MENTTPKPKKILTVPEKDPKTVKVFKRPFVKKQNRDDKKKPHKKVMILICPSSQKRFEATKKFLTIHPKWVAISEDDISFMLRKDNAKQNTFPFFIDDICKRFILEALAYNNNVILDLNNINLEKINEIYELVKLKADLSFKRVDISLDDFINENEDLSIEDSTKKYEDFKLMENMIENTITFNLIKKSNRYIAAKERFEFINKTDPKLDTCVISGFNGVITIQNRKPFEFENLKNDYPNQKVINILKDCKNRGLKIIILTGIFKKYRKDIEALLKKFDVPYDQLIMRGFLDDKKRKDMRREIVLKREMFEKNIKGKYNVEFVLEDREQVVNELWRELGYVCFETEKLIE